VSSHEQPPREDGRGPHSPDRAHDLDLARRRARAGDLVKPPAPTARPQHHQATSSPLRQLRAAGRWEHHHAGPPKDPLSARRESGGGAPLSPPPFRRSGRRHRRRRR
jgi:hypothetical protein